MKKIGFIFTALLLFGVGNVFAQTNTDNVAVSATVQDAITVTTNQDILFGNIQQLSASLDATSGDPNAPVGTNIGSTAQLGTVTISGTSGVDTILDYTDATLSDGAATPTTIAFTTDVSIGGALVASGATVNLVGGTVDLQVGGSLAAPTATGVYSTSLGGSPVVITVTYL